ncbi:MAG: flagellar filament capping protein FliD [Planctomycetes bacterium]|nr:flagellar filament capping protein FliD [Planctomycetota bacterium]
MGRIQSNVGLITGIPITDTVDQLIGVAGRSRDLLTSRTQGLQQQQIAVNTLSSRILSLKFDLGKLKVSTPFQARSVTSANEEVLTAILGSDGKPPLGNFSLRPAQTASSQQLISQRFESLDDIQSVGSLNFGFGGFVDKGISLDALNNGAGVERGEIKITDLAGNSATVDLSLARTVDDVLDTINNEASLNVTASTVGDTFVLSDTVGGGGTLSVQEVSGGTTAANLGLAGISTTNASATGADVFGLYSGTKLTALNDGNGVRFTDDTTLPDDLLFTLNDGTTDIGVDLTGATTLGDVVDAINNDDDLTGKVTAAISADGNRLELTDITVGAGFTVTNGTTGSAADDLGLTTTEVGGVITGNRLVSGLRDTLVSSLNGGQGIGPLGDIDLTNRNGDNSTVDLSAVETLGDVVDAINNDAIGITATINTSRNGIVLTDTTGQTTSNLIVANGGAETLADALGITIDAAVDSVNGGSLGRQTLSEATLLSSLNGGEGITPSDIRITDSSGKQTAIDLNASGNEANTIGDVIDAINAATIGVQARINDSGDGILITDTALGEEKIVIEDVSGTLAADLNLTRSSETIDINGTDTQVIDGRSSYSIDLTDLSTTNSSISLESINDGSGVTLSDIRFTDSQGKVLSLDLNGEFSTIKTVDELIDTINTEADRTGVGLTASINSAGTGIKLTDTANGDGNLLVEDINGTAAADFKILSTASTTNTINGFGLFEAQTASQGALTNLAAKINNLESGVTASVLNDGVGFRLQLVVDKTGAENEILLDAGSSGFAFRETSSARDALLVVGAGNTAGSGVLVSSSTNDFEQVINGVDLTAASTSDAAVDVSVTKNGQELVDLVQSFVDSYNTLRDDLSNLTDFDSESLSTGLLFGTNEALRVDTELSRLITDRYSGLGSFQSLQEIGISVDGKGKLELDSGKLQDAFDKDSQSLQTLFTAKDKGIVAKFEAAIESLTGAENGLLTRRDNSLKTTIEANEARIERFNESLERQRERLLLQFFQLEQVIAGLQTTQQAVNSFQSVPPLNIGR